MEHLALLEPDCRETTPTGKWLSYPAEMQLTVSGIVIKILSMRFPDLTSQLVLLTALATSACGDDDGNSEPLLTTTPGAEAGSPRDGGGSNKGQGSMPSSEGGEPDAGPRPSPEPEPDGPGDELPGVVEVRDGGMVPEPEDMRDASPIDASPRDSSVPPDVSDARVSDSNTGETQLCNNDAVAVINMVVRLVDESGLPVCNAEVRLTNGTAWEQELSYQGTPTHGGYFGVEFYGDIEVEALAPGFARGSATTTLDQCTRQEAALIIQMYPAVDGGTPDRGCTGLEAGVLF